MIDLQTIQDWFPSNIAGQIFEVILALVAGFVLSRILAFVIGIMAPRNSRPQSVFVVQKVAKYTVAVATVFLILQIVGADLKVILGAAGVLSLAIGFAAQTSASNLISGLFLIFEKPFVVGDFIEVNGIKGEVLSVDLLSMRIKTADNLLVRVPNEAVMKTQVINYSYFPIRRWDLMLSLSYTDDLDKVNRILQEIVENNPYCLDEPKPLFLVQKMGEYSIEVKFCVWTERKNILELQSSFCDQARQAFMKNDVAPSLRILRPGRFVTTEAPV